MRTSVVVAIAAALVACNGTSTGNPFDDDEENTTGAGHEYAHCDSEETVLDGVDAETPRGFTAADVLAFSAGVHETTIRWQPSAIASYGPETGEHALTLRITYTDGEVRFLQYEPAEPDENHGEETTTGLPIATEPCSHFDAVEVDVEVVVTTDGGALDERMAGTLRASSPNWATLDLPLDADELGGAFAIGETRPAGFTLVQLTLGFGLSPIGLRGTLNGLLEQRSDDAVSAAAGRGPFATIGDDASCDNGGLPIAVDEVLEGVSGQDAIDRVNALADLQGVWSDGATTRVALELTHDGERVCTILEPALGEGGTPAGTMRLRGTLGAQSEDGRLDASWPVMVEALPPEDGRPGAINVVLDDERLGDISAAELATASGVPGVDGSGYDNVNLSVGLELDAEALVTGHVLVRGFDDPNCPTAQAEPQPGGGASSPGCPGSTITEIESLALSE